MKVLHNALNAALVGFPQVLKAVLVLNVNQGNFHQFLVALSATNAALDILPAILQAPLVPPAVLEEPSR